jgi:hypothetical protein
MTLEESIRSEDYQHWPDFARDAFNERIALMREANNIPDKEPTPDFVASVALLQAQAEIELCR